MCTRTATKVDSMLDDMDATSVRYLLAHLLTSSLASKSKTPNLAGRVGVCCSLRGSVESDESDSLMLEERWCAPVYFSVRVFLKTNLSFSSRAVKQAASFAPLALGLFNGRARQQFKTR